MQPKRNSWKRTKSVIWLISILALCRKGDWGGIIRLYLVFRTVWMGRAEKILQILISLRLSFRKWRRWGSSIQCFITDFNPKRVWNRARSAESNVSSVSLIWNILWTNCLLWIWTKEATIKGTTVRLMRSNSWAIRVLDLMMWFNSRIEWVWEDKDVLFRLITIRRSIQTW